MGKANGGSPPPPECKAGNKGSPADGVACNAPTKKSVCPHALVHTCLVVDVRLRSSCGRMSWCGSLLGGGGDVIVSLLFVYFGAILI